MKFGKSTPGTWQHLGRARITDQTPSSLQLGEKTNLITPKHADTRTGNNTYKYAAECGVQDNFSSI